MHDRPHEVIPDEAHVDIAKALFNRSWTLLDTPNRTPEQDDELIATAQASYWHWLQVGTALNMERAQWLIARCCAEVGQGPMALHHADRCLAACLANDHGAFDLAFAHESRAHTLIALTDFKQTQDALDAAALEGASIASDEDRTWLTDNLDELRRRLET